MKLLLSIIAIIVLTGAAVLITGSSYKQLKKVETTTSGKDKGIVVMELFTSQGCSSCPPADELLGKYAEQKDANIFPISFHVDYWNRLGWQDSLSSNQYTQRQNEYGTRFKLESVYTPQLIINGQYELVGSNEEKINARLEKATAENVKASIDILKTDVSAGKITVEYAVNDLPSHININAALLQMKVITHVEAGENRGMELTNYNVVREFITRPVTGKTGSCTLQLHTGIDKTGYQVVLFLQEENYGKILAAARTNLK